MARNTKPKPHMIVDTNPRGQTRKWLCERCGLPVDPATTEMCGFTFDPRKVREDHGVRDV